MGIKQDLYTVPYVFRCNSLDGAAFMDAHLYPCGCMQLLEHLRLQPYTTIDSYRRKYVAPPRG